ncbi:MAG: hypothetical protein WCL07_02980 [bacterium]
MRKFILFGSYIWATTLAGLAVHPYKSVKSMVLREHILLPVTLSPVIGLIALFVVGRVGSRVVHLLGLPRELMAATLGITLIGLLLWQGLLLVLVWRFARVKE